MTISEIQNLVSDLQAAREQIWKMYLADMISNDTYTKATAELTEKIHNL
jgi:hypothetical protein